MQLRCYWCSEPLLYDGSQLRSLFAYTQFGILGDSIVAWVGPCEVPPNRILDVEDRRGQQRICGKEMLHFVVELFDASLSFGVLLQRVMATMAMELLHEMSPLDLSARPCLLREGDDLLRGEKIPRSGKGQKRGKT